MSFLDSLERDWKHSFADKALHKVEQFVDELSDEAVNLLSGGSHSHKQKTGTAQPQPFEKAAERSDAALSNVSLGDGTYTSAPGHRDGYVWPQAQIMDAQLSLPQTTALQKQEEQSFSALSKFGSATTGYAPRLNDNRKNAKYYDDNAWVGIDLAKDYARTHNPAELQQAQQLFHWELSGWDAKQGGEFWKQGTGFRPAVATGAMEQFALDLFSALPKSAQYDGQRSQYLQFAVTANKWMNQTLMDKSGLYRDHVGTDAPAAALYTYNQGLMIGNEAKLYQITHKNSYLKNADKTAYAAIAHFPNIGNSGMDVCMAGTFAENLEVLNTVLPDSHIQGALIEYAKQAEAQTGADGMIKGGGTKTSVDQAGAIQIEEAAAEAEPWH